MVVSDYAIKLKTGVFAALFFIIVSGLYCYFTLPREAFPDITVPYVFISTSYEGVSPEEMENLITIKLEKKLKGIDNVKEISSVSVEGFSNITIEFYPKQDIDSAVQKVKDKVDLAKSDLPNDLKSDPTVSEVNLSTDIPVLTVAFYGNDSLRLLKKVVEDIQEQVEAVPGVLEAKIFGDREREIRVEIDIRRLNTYRISGASLVNLIRNENSTVTGGNIEMDGGKFQIRIPGEFVKPEDINNLILLVKDGNPIYLTDIAKVTDTYKDLSSISRINGKPCVSLMVQKRSGANIMNMVDKVKEILEKNSGKLPGGIKYTVTSDLSKDTLSMIWELENSILTGLILILIILPLTMGIRNSIFAALAIPFSMLIGFIFFYAYGTSLNTVLLFSLILASGMLVDDAVVIVENIYRNRCLGMSALEASTLGTDEVAWPVITSTLTTLAAFIPLMFWPDVTGEFMFYIPLGVTVTMSASLIVAMIFNPAVCSIFVKPKKEASGNNIFSRGRRYLDRTGSKIIGIYEYVIRDCLKYPLLVIGLGVLLLLASLLVYVEFQLGIDLFPDVDPRRAEVRVKYPEATEIRKTDRLVSEIEERLGKYEDIRYTLTTVGSGGGSLFTGGTSGTHLATLSIEFRDMKERKYRSSDVIDAMRFDINGFPDYGIANSAPENGNCLRLMIPRNSQNDAVGLRILFESLFKEEKIDCPVKVVCGKGVDAKKIEIACPSEIVGRIMPQIRKMQKGFAGVEIIVRKEKDGPPQSDAPISIDVSGEEYPTLVKMVQEAEKRIGTVPGIADLRDNYDSAKPELKFVVDRNRAALLGLDTGSIALFIRTAINGFNVSKFREEEDDYDITIRLPDTERVDTNALLNMLIPIPDKSPIALSSLGRFEYTSGYGTINRKNMKKTITIDADVRGGFGVDEVLAKIKAELAAMSLPEGYNFRYRGDDEDQKEAAMFLFKAFWIAVFLIIIILIVQFNSVFVPGIIMTTVLLAFIGVFSGLIVHQMRFSVVMTGIGIISLLGVVVKNAIVLIDCIKLQERRGMNAYDATVSAGKFRLRPVVLTAAATIFGLIPMAVGWSIDFHTFPPTFTSGTESSQYWRLMAIVVIYGLSVSTLLTLVLVPCLYFQIENWVAGIRRRFGFSEK